MVQLIPPKPPKAPRSIQSSAIASAWQSTPVDENHFLSRADRGRVVIFIDGASIFYVATQLGIEIDYAKLLNCLTHHGHLVHAFFYTSIDSTNERQRRFLYRVQQQGYRIITKELIQFSDGSRKANLNVEIAVDAMRLATYCDTVVLLSGDGELAYAVDMIASKGVQVEVACLRSMTSNHLINVADYFLDLSTIKQMIQKSATLL